LHRRLRKRLHEMQIDRHRVLEIASSSISRFEIWSRILNAAAAKTMVEVGVWKGDFAVHVLTHCESIAQYYMIDPWANLPDWNKPYNQSQEVFDSIYEKTMSRTAFASNKLVVLRGRTKEVIDAIPNDSLDFAYIDGDHTLRGITIDLIRMLPKMKASGLIAGDDFINIPPRQGDQFEPTLVCPFSVYFAEAMNLPIVALPFNQFLIEKNAASGFSFIDTTGRYSDISLNRLSIPQFPCEM